MNTYSERFNDIAILQLDTQGFENLSEKQKNLTYYLAQAGLYGRFISIDQGSVHNIPLFNALIQLHETIDKSHYLAKEVRDSLFILFSHNGIYHSTSGEKLNLPLNIETLNSYKNNEQSIQAIKSIWFSNSIPLFRTVQKDGVDVIKESGGNFYHNLTAQEVSTFRKDNYPQVQSDEIPPFGFNERLVKNDNSIFREVISENGLYGKYVKKIINNIILSAP